MNKVPHGIVGELYIAGAALARGYSQDEDTRRAFINNLYQVECSCELPDNIDASRLYRTGDLVRVLFNGLLDFVGRAQSISSYIKLRGYCIKLGEVLSVLETYEGWTGPLLWLTSPENP